MASPLSGLLEIIHSRKRDRWKDRNEQALRGLFGTRYSQRAEKAVVLRAPDMKGDGGVPYAAYIHPSNPDAGGYGGMSFVIFPSDEAPCLLAMCIGTQGLAPDEAILGRPGHARKINAICGWLNNQFGKGQQLAWAKADPTRLDLGLPATIQRSWAAHEPALNKYGKVVYALYQPTDDETSTGMALSAFLDILFEERGHTPLKEFQDDAEALKSAWFAHLMPPAERSEVRNLLHLRRYVVIQGPPGTGKTRLARQILADDYSGRGYSIQFHPNTSYENFVGGLAPIQEDLNGSPSLGFRFAPKPGFLIEAAAAAVKDPSNEYLLHIDEINRADLSKILGEAIFLFEPNPESRRDITLAYDFGEPFRRKLWLPDNLHVLGTMNSADRSIAILDVAVRRRFAFLSLWPNSTVVEEYGCALSQEAFKQLLSIFIEYAPQEALALVPGHSYFLGSDEERARTTLRTTLQPLLAEYLAQGYVSGFAEPLRGYVQWLDSL